MSTQTRPAEGATAPLTTPPSRLLSPRLAGTAALLFVLGSLLGPVGDLFHVISATDGYPPRMPGELRLLGLLPTWVPLLFGAATLVIGLALPASDLVLARLTSTRVPARPGLRSWGHVAAGSVAMLAIWAASGFLPLATGGPKDAVIACAGLAAWYAFDRSWQGLALGVATAITSTPVEMLLVHYGKFFYYPDCANFLGVPSWLPWLYFTASVSTGNLGRALLGGLEPAR